MAVNRVGNEYDNESSQNLNMSDFTLGERKDLVLKLCLKYPKKEADITDVKRILFPNDSNDDIKLLLESISEHETEIIKIKSSRSNLYITTNERTKSFFENGGFTKIENERVRSSNKEREKEELESEKSAIDLRLKRRQLKTFWWVFGFTLISFGLSIYNFIDNLSSSKNRTQQEIRIDKIEDLTINKKSNDSLRNSKILKSKNKTK